MSEPAQPAWIGVVIVAYNAADFIVDCLESLAAADTRLKIAVVDNASSDDTEAVIGDWASGAAPFRRPADWPAPQRDAAPKPLDLRVLDADAAMRAGFDDLGAVTLIRSGANRGFAGGVNLGLRALARHDAIDLFWVLNPDSVIDPDAPRAYRVAAGAGDFALMSGRTLYYEQPDRIQADGGWMRWWRGFAVTVNRGAQDAATPFPDPAGFDFVSGANMVASRLFLERVGVMDESWFLYYEEIDWALRRGDLPLRAAEAARIYHRAGASIGSAGQSRMESPFAAYFSFRNLLRFNWRWNRWRTPLVYGFALLVILRKYALAGGFAQAGAALRALHGAPPPRAVRNRLPEAIWRDLAARGSGSSERSL